MSSSRSFFVIALKGDVLIDYPLFVRRRQGDIYE